MARKKMDSVLKRGIETDARYLAECEAYDPSQFEWLGLDVLKAPGAPEISNRRPTKKDAESP